MTEAIADVLRARRIEVVDRDGIVRFSVECPDGPEDSVVVETYTPKGLLGFAVITDDEGPEAQMWWRGNEHAALGLDEGEFYSRTGLDW